jgi:hydrogenase nickel incorporation protein HypA/HybF
VRRARRRDGATFASQPRVHELAVMEGVVDVVVDRLGDERIASVRLAIGTLAGVDIAALRSCFEICAKDTTLAGATLEIRSIEARARCKTCGDEHALRSFASPCPCGSFDHELLAGDELRLEEVEIY